MGTNSGESFMRQMTLEFVVCAVLVLGLAVGSYAERPADRPFWRTVVMGTNGMVSAEHPLECRAAIKVLEGGGNAIDAAVAAFYMTTVVEQHQAGIGGDGFILAYIAKEDRVIFINGTGPAPRLATPEFYRKLGKIPDAGPYSTDVPGAVGGFDLVLKKYGTMDYAELLKPAIEAAGKGHPLSFWAAGYHGARDDQDLAVSHFSEGVTQERRAVRPRRCVRAKGPGPVARNHRQRRCGRFLPGPLGAPFG